MRREFAIAFVFFGVLILLFAVSSQSMLGSSGHELVIAELGGEVQVRGGDGSGNASVGQVLGGSERLTTGQNSRAVLAFGSDTQIRLGEVTDITILSVGSDGVDIELEDGSVHATVRPTASPVRIGRRERRVQATDGEFSVAVDGELLMVESRRGDLMLRGVGGHDVVHSGERLLAAPQAVEALPIPEDLLLAVEWPTDMRTRAPSTEVRGTTSPGAKVHVSSASASVTVDADLRGAFVAKLSIAEGENDIRVRAVDLFGEAAEVRGLLVRDTQGPVFRGGVK